jgi:hypothetical protein
MLNHYQHRIRPRRIRHRQHWFHRHFPRRQLPSLLMYSRSMTQTL